VKHKDLNLKYGQSLGDKGSLHVSAN